MTRASVTKVQLRRVLDVLAERGQKVSEVLSEGGTVRLRLTDGTDAPLPSPETDSSFSERLAAWRRSG